MKTNPLPENGHTPPGKPVTERKELLNAIGSGEVCKECLNEDFDTCVCPEPHK